MRKRIYMGIILAILIMVTLGYLFFIKANNIVLRVGGGDIPYISVYTTQSENKIMLWQSEEGEQDYFFLPSCVNHHRIKLGDCGSSKVWIDGQLFGRGDNLVWEDDRVYQMQIIDDNYEKREYSIIFMKSANIPAVFINTASGSMEYLNEDKLNRETGGMCIVRKDGSTEYQGELSWISGRGNSTWGYYDKKPYSIKLPKKYPLCNLDKGDKWCLLALWCEGSKLNTKIAMDMTQALGHSYGVQGTWIDLYLNGEYVGIYMLAESVSVGKGRVEIHDLEKDNQINNVDIDYAEYIEEEDYKGYRLDNGDNISGGYLIEKDGLKSYVGESNGFITSSDDVFIIKAPAHASEEQVLYIKDYVENIDQMIENGEDTIWEYLDMESFAERFLVDEISLDMDTALASMYFYKERDEDKLYSGPPWDYDRGFGECGFGDRERYLDYTGSVIQNTKSEVNSLQWYVQLYDTPQLQQCIIQKYTDLMPFFEELLYYKIDYYTEQIRDSVRMDQVIWADKNLKDDFSGKSTDYEINVKYTKYFIAKRLNYLCKRWGVVHEEFTAPSNGELHLVTFANRDGIVGTMQIADGTEIEEMPEYDASIYQGWENQCTGEKYSKYVPIYEDTTFYNGRW